MIRTIYPAFAQCTDRLSLSKLNAPADLSVSSSMAAWKAFCSSWYSTFARATRSVSVRSMGPWELTMCKGTPLRCHCTESADALLRASAGTARHALWHPPGFHTTYSQDTLVLQQLSLNVACTVRTASLKCRPVESRLHVPLLQASMGKCMHALYDLLLTAGWHDLPFIAWDVHANVMSSRDSNCHCKLTC